MSGDFRALAHLRQPCPAQPRENAVPNRAWRSVAVSTALLLGAAVLAGLPARPAAAAQPGCRVDYAVTAEFNSGFVVYITIANDGPATNGWQIDFT
ncbi:MAG TPA: cellulose binding domain-containing protein, partial [Mycobacteriales bacterium]|nr:cellulose binding domain-containing protein [Mycobacteriales bacterium]